MIPLIYVMLAMMMAGTGIEIGADVYARNESNKAQDYAQAFYSGAMAENSAYWERYIRMHHLENRRIMFPYRTGFNYNATGIYQAQATKAQNNARIIADAGRAARQMAGAYGIYTGVYRPRKSTADIMYG